MPSSFVCRPLTAPAMPATWPPSPPSVSLTCWAPLATSAAPCLSVARSPPLASRALTRPFAPTASWPEPCCCSWCRAAASSPDLTVPSLKPFTSCVRPASSVFAPSHAVSRLSAMLWAPRAASSVPSASCCAPSLASFRPAVILAEPASASTVPSASWWAPVRALCSPPVMVAEPSRALPRPPPSFWEPATAVSRPVEIFEEPS